VLDGRRVDLQELLKDRDAKLRNEVDDQHPEEGYSPKRVDRCDTITRRSGRGRVRNLQVCFLVRRCAQPARVAQYSQARQVSGE
jgi:hypothetical protein